MAEEVRQKSTCRRQTKRARERAGTCAVAVTASTCASPVPVPPSAETPHHRQAAFDAVKVVPAAGTPGRHRGRDVVRTTLRDDGPDPVSDPGLTEGRPREGRVGPAPAPSVHA
ncbi:hypothetical protein GCM10010299_25100 [Streptomyces tanashiensis]|nr:hypothetical protein GCM10010299_25100 [Streptomyces tanashiensis]